MSSRDQNARWNCASMATQRLGWPSHITGAYYDTFVSLSVVGYLLFAIFCLFAKSAVRHLLHVCILLSCYSLWNRKIHQYTNLSLKILQHTQKLLETSRRFVTHGGLDISLSKRKRHCTLLYRSLLRRNRWFVIVQALVYIISAEFLTHISFILEWHWQWRRCVWEHPWIWQPQPKKG